MNHYCERRTVHNLVDGFAVGNLEHRLKIDDRISAYEQELLTQLNEFLWTINGFVEAPGF